MSAVLNESGPAISNVTAGNVSEEPPKYRVWDTLASIGAPRIHEIIVRTYPEQDGREPDIARYSLSSDGDGTPMPVDHALKFLSDKAFIVRNPLGDRIEPPASVEGGLGGFDLKPDQVIANYTELSKPALFKRCKLLPGGEVIQGGDSAEDMIAFLKAFEAKRRRAASGDPLDEKLGELGLEGKATQAQLERMFPTH
jgi:hypothetical protein